MSVDIQFNQNKLKDILFRLMVSFYKRKSFQVMENINTKSKVPFMDKFTFTNKMKNESYQQSI
jgi:hypothetical protein